MRHSAPLLLAALLGLSACSPQSMATLRPQPLSPYAEEQDTAAQIVAFTPSYAGHWIDPQRGLIIALSSSDSAEQPRVYQAVSRVDGSNLPGKMVPRFQTVRYSYAELLRVKQLVTGISGWTALGIDVRNNRVDVTLGSKAKLTEAQRFLTLNGVPAELVNFSVGAFQTLPDQP